MISDDLQASRESFSHILARSCAKPAGGCQAPAALLVLAALRYGFLLDLLSRVDYLFVGEL